MAPRRPTFTPVAPAAPAPSVFLAFGDMGTYGASFSIPEGRYAVEHEIAMERLSEKQQGRNARLGLYVHAYALNDLGKPDLQPQSQFLAFGTKAHLSWAPDASTGKRIVPIEGGQNQELPPSSNAALYLKSYYDAGLEKGVFVDDISALDGIWVHIQSIPEPERNFGSGTAEVEQEGQKKDRKIPIVTEILDGGKPWEGGGGFDAAPAQAAPAPGPRAVAPRAAAPAPAPAARPAPRTAPGRAAALAPAPVEAAQTDSDEVSAAVATAAGDFIGNNPNGTTMLKLRTAVFNNLGKSLDANGVQEAMAYFFTQGHIAEVLEAMGYTSQGSGAAAQIVPKQ